MHRINSSRWHHDAHAQTHCLCHFRFLLSFLLHHHSHDTPPYSCPLCSADSLFVFIRYTYVNGSAAGNYKTCYLRDMNSVLEQSPNCVATNPTYDCYSGSKTCASTAPQHHMDTAGAGVGSSNNVASWEACRDLCCANPKCGT